MNEKTFFKASLYFMVFVTIAMWSLLAWDYYHGGVPKHHILHREDLPAISNWWGALIIPLLTWLLLLRIKKRLVRDSVDRKDTQNVIYRFFSALFFGILLSVLFSLGYTDALGYLFIGVLLIALLFPIYMAECLLGFVIGMTFTFGAVLPTVFALILALVSAVLYLYVRPQLLKIDIIKKTDR